MKAISTVLGVALFAQSSLQHAAPLPPTGDKILTPNSSTPPDPGCKLLASDKGFPDNATWVKELPQSQPKPRGTLGPDFIVLAKNVSDVQASVNFASKHNVRLSVITTGHDFHGREGARSGLRIDLSAMHDPIVFANGWKCGDNLAPKGVVARNVDDTGRYQEPAPGAKKPKYKFFKRHEPGEEEEEVPAYNTIKPQAGVQAVARVPAGTYHELFYDAADKSGLFVMGAQHGGVSSIGGWAQAGGHNPLVNHYGMQADQILEYEVVTADGKFQKVSNCPGANQDLFWALRGGGGSTFGVVTAATVKVYPTPPIVVGRFFVNSTSPKLWDAAAYFLQNAAKLRDTYGAGAYYYIYNNAFQSTLNFPTSKYATVENAKAALEPLKKKMEELAGATPQEIEYGVYKTYKEWYVAEQGNDESMDAGIKFKAYYDGSDGSVPGQNAAMENPLSLIPWSIRNSQYPYKKRSLEVRYKEVRAARTALQRRDMEMTSSLARPMSRTYLDSRLLSDKMVNSVSQAQLAKLVNQTFKPDVPNCHIRGFLYGGAKQQEPKVDDVGLLPAWRTMTHHFIVNAVPGDWRHDYDIKAISDAFPDAGAYVNEASPGEPRWKQVFWGAHYQKLESIKKQVDPKNVFWCSPCVGADMFTYDDERICPNKAYPQEGPAPQTYYDLRSKVGIASLQGQDGIENPLTPFVIEYLTSGKLPAKTPAFDPNNGYKPVPEGQEPMDDAMGMPGMQGGGLDSSQQQPATAQPLASSATPAPSPAPATAAPPAAPPAAATPAAPAPAANSNPLAGLFSGLNLNRPAAAAPAASASPAAQGGLAGFLAGLNLPFSLPNIQLPKIGG